MRNKIQEKITTVDKNVFYGIVPPDELPDEWNYTVFGQARLRKKGAASQDLQGYWYVTIVRENYIPDDDVFNMISALEEIHGLKLADGDMNYDYIVKPNTSIVCEVLELDFTKTKKAAL